MSELEDTHRALQKPADYRLSVRDNQSSPLPKNLGNSELSLPPSSASDSIIMDECWRNLPRPRFPINADLDLDENNDEQLFHDPSDMDADAASPQNPKPSTDPERGPTKPIADVVWSLFTTGNKMERATDAAQDVLPEFRKMTFIIWMCLSNILES